MNGSVESRMANMAVVCACIVALPVVEEALAGASGGLALFVHLYGCHNPATRRVPKNFRRQ